MPKGPRGEKGYEVRSGDSVFPNLSAVEALAKLREQIAEGADPFLYDQFGDPMGLVDLEDVIAIPKGSSSEKRPTDT